MKITKLHIKQYKHLENLDFDFTYQSGEKKGQPLEKICFIGQSATGKTNLLELVFASIKYALKLEVINGTSLSYNLKNYIVSNSNFDFELKLGNDIFSKKKDTVYYKQRPYGLTSDGGSVTSLIEYGNKKNLLYFKSNLISDSNIDVFTKNPIELFEKHSDRIVADELVNYYSDSSRIFDDKIDETSWVVLLSEILDYRKKFNQKMSELVHKGLLADTKKLQKEFEKWQKDNPNKLEQFAEKFNPILDKLNLSIDIINTEYTIPISNKYSEEVFPIQYASTGTKGLLLSFVPLFKLDTKDSVIIIDEPERSLYPDMQIDLMDYYRSFAPNSQIIVATHSPFIAAAFEPDERFILYFNEKGKVEVKRGDSPIGDDPNDILHNDFGLETLLNKTGKEIHNYYLEKKRQILFEKDEKKKKKLQQEIESIGDKYNF